VKGKEPEALAFMPIAGEEFVYEMVLKCLLLPAANGVPTWQSENTGERMMIKLPEQFRDSSPTSRSCPKTSGEARAVAAGANGSAPAVNPPELLARFEASRTLRRCGRSKRSVARAGRSAART